MSAKHIHYGGTGWIEVDLVIPDAQQILKDSGLGPAGYAQQELTHIILRRIGRYMPRRSGGLYDLTKAQTRIRDGLIITRAPQARYLFEGEIMGPNIPIFENGVLKGFFSPPGKKKHLTGRRIRYSRTGADRAGPHWDEALVNAEGDEIVREYQDYINRRTK